MTREQVILSLQTHKDNIAAAKSFEEYQAAHIAYINMLIKDQRGKQLCTQAIEEFVGWQYIATQIITKTTEIE